MERRIGRDAGGILGLLELHSEHGEAIEHDLIALGLRWRQAGTARLSWRDVWVVVQGAQPGSAVFRARSAGGAGWSQSDYINADLIDATNRVAYYVHATRSKTRVKPPKPYPRPGKTRGETTKYGTEPMSLPDMIRWLGWEDRPEVAHVK